MSAMTNKTSLAIQRTGDGEVWVKNKKDGTVVATFRVRTKGGSMNAGLNLDLANRLVSKVEQDYEMTDYPIVDPVSYRIEERNKLGEWVLITETFAMADARRIASRLWNTDMVRIIKVTKENVSKMNEQSEAPEQKDPVAANIVAIKTLRRTIDKNIQTVRALAPCREQALCITKLQEAVMWLGMNLKAINEANPGLCGNPYPSSKDPSTGTKIEPTADNLKL